MDKLTVGRKIVKVAEISLSTRLRSLVGHVFQMQIFLLKNGGISMDRLIIYHCLGY